MITQSLCYSDTEVVVVFWSKNVAHLPEYVLRCPDFHFYKFKKCVERD